MARYVDASNYYYMTVRSSNTLSLRKLNNGAITVLATVPLPVSVESSYALRLEVVGSRLRGYVNGRLLVEATDSTHARGMGGVAMYKTSADFINYRAYQP
jgi:pectate lyase